MDAAKFADLVLLLVDGHFGFELETFEFLNILQARDAGARRATTAAQHSRADRPPPRPHLWPQVHGFPKVMGVLTHLDQFTDATKLKKVKKTLKARERTTTATWRHGARAC